MTRPFSSKLARHVQGWPASLTATAAASNSRQRPSRRAVGLRVCAPALGLEVLVDMRGPPRGFGREKSARDRKRQQRRSGQRRHHAERGERNGIVVRVERCGDRRQRLGRLRDMRHAGCHIEARAERLRRPAQNRIEGVRLARNQRVRLLGAVAEEVGAGVAQNVGPRFGHRVRDAVDRRVEEPRQRHVGRIDCLALPLPFGRHFEHERPARRGERIAARRPRSAAVEQKRVPAIRFAHFDRLVEATDRRGPHVRLRGPHRVLAARSGG